MEHQLEKKEGGRYRLSCSFTAAEVLEVWKKAASRFGTSFRMAGFRPGKAPLEILDRQFGSRISDSVTDTLAGRAVDAVLKREALVPVTGLDYEGGNAARGRDFRFCVEFGVLPDMEVPDVEAVVLHRGEPEADPVQESLFVREILGREAKKTTVTEGRPQDGDIVSAEVTGRVNGRVVPGMDTGTCRMRLMPTRPGEKTPDLDPVLRKLRVGETGTGHTPCPDNFPDPSLRGKDIELTVTLSGIEREELPPFNDETARRLGFRNAAALQAAAHEQALDMDRIRRRSEARRALLTMLEGWEGVEAPEPLVELCRRDALRRARQYMQKQYSSPEELKGALEQMKEEARHTARRKARGRAILLAWARLRGMDVPRKDLDAVLRGRAARRNMDEGEYRLSLARTGEVFELRAAMLEEQALNALLEKVLLP